MKKILLLMVAACLSLNSFAQNYFTLTENGMTPTEASDKKFVVIEKEGQTQLELFNAIKAFATQLYVSPKDVISESGTEIITLNGISTKDVTCKKGLGVLNVKMNYTIVFQIKDGKIRIDAPSINSMTSESRTLGGTLGSLYQICLSKNEMLNGGYERIVIFDKKIKQQTKDEIESFFNTLINSAINYSAPKSEDW